MNKEIIVHAGLERTGGTFLGKEIFSKSKKYDFIKLTIPPHPKNYDITYRNMIIVGAKEYFGDAKVVVSIRDKNKWINSLYSVYIEGGGILSFNRWLTDIFNTEYLDIERYIFLLRTLFSNVFVFNLDDFNVDDLLKFLDENIKYNKSKIYHKGIKGSLIYVYRAINIFKSSIGWLYGIRYK